MKKTLITTLSIVLCMNIASAAPLFTQDGKDPSFAEVMASGNLPKGKNSRTGVKGSKIEVNHELVETSEESRQPIPEAIRIHTLGNSVIQRAEFSKWTRWYQEDGNTQIFRLFKGEVNTRNSRTNAARIEAFSNLSWQKGGWHEWNGTYTIVKPHSAAIFQAKNNINDWSVQINMNDKGDVILNHRRADDKVIAQNMVGKPFRIRVRDNGEEYEVFLEGKEVGKGSYKRPEGKTGFRWGMYLGKNEVSRDAMIFVSGVTMDQKPPQRTISP
jgi:hypothetical protein